MSEPLVSIIIPTHNDSEYLPEALKSALQQTYKNIEIIVINDGSDRPEDDAFFSQFGKNYTDPRINLRFKENEGLAKARNTGLEAAKGEFFLPLDADDKIDDMFVEKTLAPMLNDPKLGVVYTDQQFYGGENTTMPMRDFDARELLVLNHVSVCSLVRKAAWEQVRAKNAFGYNPNMKFGYEDWDFWISVAEDGWGFEHINETLFFYRKRINSMSKETQRKNDKLFEQLLANHPEMYKENHQYVIGRFQNLFKEREAYALQLDTQAKDAKWLVKRLVRTLLK